MHRNRAFRANENQMQRSTARHSNTMSQYEYDRIDDRCQDGRESQDEDREETREEWEHRRELAIFRDAFIWMQLVIGFLRESNNNSELATRALSVASALSHVSCAGQSDSDLAKSLATKHSCKECGKVTHHNVTRANFSAHKLAFQRQNNLPAIGAQKSVEARNAYSDNRKSQLSEA